MHLQLRDTSASLLARTLLFCSLTLTPLLSLPLLSLVKKLGLTEGWNEKDIAEAWGDNVEVRLRKRRGVNDIAG